MQGAGYDKRGAILRSIVADPLNPAWDFIDQRKVLDALDRFASLPTPERRELFGAVTAALWLGDDTTI